MQIGEFGKPQPPLIEEPVLPSREEKYSVAVLEVHYQSFMPTLTASPDPRDEPRQFEGPPAEEAA